MCSGDRFIDEFVDVIRRHFVELLVLDGNPHSAAAVLADGVDRHVAS